ncbi:MAG TPA: hypothetical protein VGQ87_02720 [Patescibacteria group bacterium]|jgi:hypothetical protein|nr:hypothetical protein [Patescibacteria group bacterium]
MVISGTVLNKLYRFPLGTESWFSGRVIVYRIDDQGNRVTQNSSDCWTGQGCISQGDGSYYFYGDYNWQPFQPGTYEVEAVANAHVIQRIRITLPTQGQTNFEMTFVPAWAQVVEQSQSIPSTGGKLWARVQLYNFGSTEGIVSANSIVSGPGTTSEYTSWQVSRNLPLTEVGTYYETTVAVEIDAKQPDGAWYCSTIRIGNVNRAADEYSVSWFCAPKGTKEPVRIQ